MIVTPRAPRRLPKRSCSTPGCEGHAEHGAKCSKCWTARNRVNDAARPPSYLRGYDQTHQRLRLLCFQRDQWRCIDCGWEPDIVRASRELDLGEPSTANILEELRLRKLNGQRHLHGEHDQPIEERPDLRTDLDNYKTRCNECHGAKTQREMLARGQPLRFRSAGKAGGEGTSNLCGGGLGTIRAVSREKSRVMTFFLNRNFCLNLAR